MSRCPVFVRDESGRILGAYEEPCCAGWVDLARLGPVSYVDDGDPLPVERLTLTMEPKRFGYRDRYGVLVDARWAELHVPDGWRLPVSEPPPGAVAWLSHPPLVHAYQPCHARPPSCVDMLPSDPADEAWTHWRVRYGEGCLYLTASDRGLEIPAGVDAGALGS